MIASFFEGRVRLRHQALHDPATLAMAETFVSAQEGVKNVAANPRTGSLLVEYEFERISREILEMAAGALKERLDSLAPKVVSTEKGKCGFRLKGMSARTENFLLSGALGLALLSPLFGKQAHIGAAGIFLALTGKHVYDRWRLL